MDIRTHPLVESWTLASYEVHGSDGSVSTPLGPDPVGLGVYTVEGFVSAQLMRRAPRTDDRQDYIAYAGRWSSDGTSVSHHVDLALHDGWVGTTLVRTVTLDPGRLVLEPPATERAGVTFRAVLTWTREEAS